METSEETELCFPQLLNTSCRKHTHPFETLLIYCLLSIISMLTTSLNLLVIISIFYFKQLHTPTNLLLLSLAVTDFFVGVLMFFQSMIIDGCWLFSDLMCVLYQHLLYIITAVSAGNMILISVDRYVAICDPLHYATKITGKRIKKCIAVCWISSVIFQTYLVKDFLKQPGHYNSCSGECVVVINPTARIVDFIVTFIVPITVIVLLYMRVFVVAVSQARAMRSHVAFVSANANVMKSELKAARTLGTVIAVFLICLCPFFCVILTSQESMLNPSIAAFLICLFYFNSCLNPVIYVFCYPWFRKSVKLIVALKILQLDSREANML